MKKLSIKSLTGLLLFCSISFFSCDNAKPYPNNNEKFEIATLNSCLLNCAAKEKICWDEYDKCKGKAAAEEQTALNICNHVTSANQWECKGKALSEYRNKVEQCERNLRACLAELSNCRAACTNQLTKEPDTK